MREYVRGDHEGSWSRLELVHPQAVQKKWGENEEKSNGDEWGAQGTAISGLVQPTQLGLAKIYQASQEVIGTSE